MNEMRLKTQSKAGNSTKSEIDTDFSPKKTMLLVKSFKRIGFHIGLPFRSVKRDIMRLFRSKALLKYGPKLIVTMVGIFLFLIIAFLVPEGDIHDLLINISASLISIPLIYICYEMWEARNHKRLNHYAYEKVDNLIFEHTSEIEEEIKKIMQGMMFYFDHGHATMDESLLGSSNPVIKIEMTQYSKTGTVADIDEEYSHPDYSEKDYEDDMLRLCDEEEYMGGIYGFEKDTIGPHLFEQRYLGFQILNLSFEDICDEQKELLKNTFIMDRLEEERLFKILKIIDLVEVLNAFVKEHQIRGDLFSKIQNCKVLNMKVRKESTTRTQFGDTGAYSLWYKDKDFEKELSRDILVNVNDKELNAVYIINPDHLIIFGDLITEVLTAIESWNGGHGTRTDSTDFGYYDDYDEEDETDYSSDFDDSEDE